MEAPLHTATAAALLLLLQLGLMMAVGFKRLETGIGIGVGDNESLLLAVRRHGNLAENAAIFLVALACAEVLAGSNLMTLGIASAFVVVRIAHAVGLTIGSDANPARAIGAFGTLLSGLTIAAYLLYTIFNLS